VEGDGVNARTTAIARARREALQAERRARLAQACRDKARTVRSLSREFGCCERTIRRDLDALGPVVARSHPADQQDRWVYRTVDTGLSEAQWSAACDAALGGEMDWGTG
jgi:hypothetical protein